MVSVTITDMDDIPDIGDVEGLTRLYWQTVQRIRDMDIPEADRQGLAGAGRGAVQGGEGGF